MERVRRRHGRSVRASVRVSVAAALALGAAACAPAEKQDVSFTCKAPSDCAPGFLCVANQCVSAGGGRGGGGGAGGHAGGGGASAAGGQGGRGGAGGQPGPVGGSGGGTGVDAAAPADAQGPSMDPNLRPTLTVVSGADQTGYVNQQLQTIKLAVIDAATGDPIPKAVVTFEAPPGMALLSSSLTTNARGEVAFLPYLPLKPGKYELKAKTAGAADATVSMTATAPPAGTIFTISNVTNGPDHQRADTALLTTFGHSVQIVRMSDGRILLADGSLFVLEPSGQLTMLSKPCSYGSNSGDDGPPSGACISGHSIAAHPTKNTVYIAAGYREIGFQLREIDFARNLVTRIAGGGKRPGINIPAIDSSVPIDRVQAALPDGSVVFSEGTDPYEGKLAWRVNPDGLLQPWNFHPSNPTCGGSVPSAFGEPHQNLLLTTTDPAGRIYVLAQACGPAGNKYPLLFRMEAGGALTHVAGRDQGTTADGAAATAYDLRPPGGAPNSMVASEKAIFLLHSLTQILKIDLTTGTVSHVAGAVGGSSEDYKPAKSSAFYSTAPIALHPDGHLLIADVRGTHRVRMIWNP